ncbi:PSD1 and planctomycete cytochrome C domain-containing protein [Schlesneria sp. DSM 10557]|uniref:PSD1 and planctomycete cytochrome C domain-containing protein n=1 Tax=Schlesneria sp. DSM 10557 TaxID=3044399 RepID=UPI00359FA1A6
MPVVRFFSALLCCAILTSLCPLVAHADDAAVDYSTQVKPILLKHCADCHGKETQQSSLRLDSAKGVTTGGDSGPAVIAGDSARSLLIHAITGTEGALQMPPDGDKLAEADVAMLRRWIDQGAHSPGDEVTEPAVAKTSRHWAFQPVRRVIPPTVEAPFARHNGIDNFIQDRLLREELTPSEAADKTTLVRRVHFDLLGLPPSVETVQEFVSDSSPDAYERLVDRLLASPHFGERWARDWLDSARYADSNGFTRDQPRTIWKYRDWVIDALNQNLSFKQFVIEQIAGDLLPDPTLEQLIATGFHRNTLINEEGGTDPEQFRVEAVVDRVNTTGAVFLGLTVGCAQCHDHKYDPISQREYYQLYAFFNSNEFHAGDPTAPRIDVPSKEQIRSGEPERWKEIQKTIQRLEQELKDQISAIADDLTAWEKTLTEEDKAKLPFNVKNALDLPPVDRSETHKRDLDAYFRRLPISRSKYPQLDEIGRLRQTAPQFATTMITREINPPRETYIQIRGDFLRKGAPVQPAIPAVLKQPAAQAASPGPELASITNRLQLAEWLTAPENPLTPRVIANRYWQRIFGRGIVETENDFGIQGDPPTHPELLDWLAAEFRRDTTSTGAASDDAADANSPSQVAASDPRAWDLKAFLRGLVLSATYRQSSHSRSDLIEQDPMNKLLARQARIRVDAEMIRDAALTVSGLLTTELGGPPVYPPQPEGVFDFTQDKKPWKTSTGRDRFRKGLYTHIWRSSIYPAMAAFDFPEPNVACTRRIRSNTPLQSLTLANDQTFFEFARGFAVRLLEAPAGDDSDRLMHAVQVALGREPNSQELARLRGFLHEQRDRFAQDIPAAEAFAPNPAPAGISLTEAAAWTAVSRVLLNLDEFITRE